MRSFFVLVLALGLLAEATGTGTSIVMPLQINLSERVPHMLDLVQRTHLPSAELPAAKDSYNTTVSSGVPLSTLNGFQEEWITSFNWENEQESINRYDIEP
jgi:hypothetical protein